MTRSKTTQRPGRRNRLRPLVEKYLQPVPRNHRQARRSFRRRQVVSVATLMVGAPVLRIALRQPAGSPEFRRWTLALAGVWTAGALASGPLHLGRSTNGARPVVRPLVTGAAAVALFSGGGIAAVQVPALRHEIDSVIRHARYGDLREVVPLALVTGVSEELFFRGALYAATPVPHQLLVTTAVYATVTAATGNPMLILASVLLGSVTALARRTTGGVQSPAIIHAVWTSGMLAVLPELTARAAAWHEHLSIARIHRDR